MHNRSRYVVVAALAIIISSAALVEFTARAADPPAVVAPQLADGEQSTPWEKALAAADKRLNDPAYQTVQKALEIKDRDRRVARNEALKKLAAAAPQEFAAGQQSLESVLDILRKSLDAELESSATAADRIALGKKFLATTTDLESRASRAAESDNGPRAAYLQAKAARLAAELALDCEQFGLRRPEVEIKCRQDRVDYLKARYDEVALLNSVQAKGGETDRLCYLGRELSLARADLALAQADKPRGVKFLLNTAAFAEAFADSHSVNYTFGDEFPLDFFLALDNDIVISQIMSRLAELSPETLAALQSALIAPAAPPPVVAADSPAPAAAAVKSPTEDKFLAEWSKRIKLNDEKFSKPESLAERAAREAKLHDTQIARRDTLTQLLKLARDEYTAGKRTLSSVLDISGQLRDAELDLADTPAGRLAALESHSARVKKLAAQAATDGKSSHADVSLAKAAAAAAELAVDRERFGARRSAAEILALQARAESALGTYQKVAALYAVMAKGGETDNFARAIRELASARADLALAQADKPQAIEHLKIALDVAYEFLDIEQTLVDRNGGPDITAAVDALTAKSQIELKLAQLSPESVVEIRKGVEKRRKERGKESPAK